jgi:enoyl-CoA hydratase/carnithine racemase
MIRVATEGSLRRITLDRPARANALTAAMLADLAAAVAAPGAQAIVLTGAGTVFSAGADLDEVAAAGLATSPLWAQVAAALASAPALTVAALNGATAGGALGIAAACDLRVAVPGATLFYPALDRGVMPQPSDPARLAALAGPATATRLLLAGARLTAAEALRTGLVDALAEPPDLIATAEALCAAALAARPHHLAAIKTAIPRA